VDINMLSLWSAVALVLRVVALVLLGFVARMQFQQFKFKTSLQPLKRLLFALVIAIGLSNLPILYLHVQRVLSVPADDTITSFATVTNALGQLILAVLLVLVYRFKSGDDT
jgi:hypothetical protein